MIEVAYSTAGGLGHVRAVIDKMNLGEFAVQSFGSSNTALDPAAAEGRPVERTTLRAVMTALKADDPGVPSSASSSSARRSARSSTRTARWRCCWCARHRGYLALRFEWRFAVAAIIANLHDVVIILGFFALFQWEFSLPVLAAVLAVLGYSVNESVVIADRIRENFRKMRKATVPEVIDNAITSTMSRTIITHGCTLMMVLSILFFGGETLHYFALALTIGICFGIYSSVLVMAPLVMWLGVSREDLVKPERTGAGSAEKILP